MCKYDPARAAGRLLRQLINENYPSQDAFAYDYGVDLRTVSRYINKGIKDVKIYQELAEFFHIDFWDFVERIKNI